MFRAHYWGPASEIVVRLKRSAQEIRELSKQRMCSIVNHVVRNRGVRATRRCWLAAIPVEDVTSVSPPGVLTAKLGASVARPGELTEMRCPSTPRKTKARAGIRFVEKVLR